MANDILEQEARTRQSHVDIPGISKKASDVGELDGILQAMTFSLTFTSSQWCLFWRLLNVGCVLADELLDLYNNPKQVVCPNEARLWNTLSTELAACFKKDEIKCNQEGNSKTTR